MDYVLMVFSSSTTAGRLKRAAQNQRIKAMVIQTPKSISEKGCTYSVKCDERDFDNLMYIAKQLSVIPVTAYREMTANDGRKHYRAMW